NRMQQLRAQSQQASDSIKAVLTAKQKAALPQATQELAQLRMAGIPLQALGELNLTNDQKLKLKGFAQAAMQKMRAAAPAEGGAGGPAGRGNMREMRQEMRGQVQSLLTDPQKAILQKYRRERRRGQGGPDTGA